MTAWEVVSALRKDVKLGTVAEAIYWATVLREFSPRWETAHKLIAKQLWISAAEDIDDPAVVLRAFAFHQMATVVPETEHMMFLIAQMCAARKYWEHEDGREVDRLVCKALGDVKVPERHRPIPAYALDRHTRRGWQVFRSQRRFTDEFSGTYLGRAKTVYLFLRDGFVNGESKIGEDPGFTEFWGERRALLAQQGDEIEPNDPFATEALVTGDDQGRLL